MHSICMRTQVLRCAPCETIHLADFPFCEAARVKVTSTEAVNGKEVRRRGVVYHFVEGPKGVTGEWK
jgi:hypothetical protein